MLTADHVRTRRRKGTLHIVKLSAESKMRALELAGGMIRAAKEHVGSTRAELEEAMAALPISHQDRKISEGLKKLVFDRCEIEMDATVDPVELRMKVFTLAAEMRREAVGPEEYDRKEVFARVAEELDRSVDEIESLLQSDLRQHHRVRSFASLSQEQLLALYEEGQAQAILLKALRVRVHVFCRTPAGYRALFRKLKFLRLMHTIERADAGFRIDIDGPCSLFSSVTKYGLQLALILPLLRTCSRYTLSAQVRWGKDKTPLEFQLEGQSTAEGDDPQELPPEVEVFLERFRKKSKEWRVSIAQEIFHLPGVGECVPDLVFDHSETGKRVFLEVLGYWSRDAVFKRVELAERGLPRPILFAVPKKLRVSEELLEESWNAQLYVYKQSLSVAEILSRLDSLMSPASGEAQLDVFSPL